MSITPVDKVKITKYLRENPIGEIYYLDLCDALGKRGKIKDIEFLEFFVEAVIKEFKKNEKISIKQVSKLVVTVESFLEWVHEAGSEIDEVILDKIRSFEEYYDEYLNRTNNDIDLEFTDGYLASLLKVVNELYPKEEKSESVVQYLNEIADLKEQLRTLKKEYDNLAQLHASAQRKMDQVNKTYYQKSSEVSNLLNTISNNERIIGNLNKSISELEQKVKVLEAKLELSGTELDDLRPYKGLYEELVKDFFDIKEQLRISNEKLDECKGYRELYENLLAQFNELTDKVEQQRKEKAQQDSEKRRDKHLMELIYSQLIDGKITINGLVSYLKDSKGMNVSPDKIKSLMVQLKREFNIASSSFATEPSYSLVMPRYVTDDTFTIDVPYDCECYDILLVSDFHISSFDKSVLSEMDAINNYCVNNNIKLILNLGDFFEGFGGSRVFDYENAKQNYHLTEKAISLIPKADGIYHAVLGGNHDKNILRYGFNPIEMLAQERDDFINLGFTHSTIALNGFSGILGQFDLHHPQTFFSISVKNSGIDTDGLNEYLNKIYGHIYRSRDDSYIDIFGHTHKNRFSFVDSYCFVPPLVEGQGKKGAYHLRVYFEPNTEIKYMLFMPLSFTDKLVANNEIVYKKILSK